MILSVGFGVPALAVDTHVLRIANRLGYCATDKPEDAEKALTGLIPEKLWTPAHLLFIRHGRSLCKAVRPLCAACPVRVECPFDGTPS